jgi:hypothetical protein
MDNPFNGGFIDGRDGQRKKPLGFSQVFRRNRGLDFFHQGLDAANDRLVANMAFQRLPLPFYNRLMDLYTHFLCLPGLTNKSRYDRRNEPLKSRGNDG